VTAQVCIGLHSQYSLSSVGFRCLHRPVQPTAAKTKFADAWSVGRSVYRERVQLVGKRGCADHRGLSIVLTGP